MDATNTTHITTDITTDHRPVEFSEQIDRQPIMEEWKAVIGYEGVYEVSSEGNVKRIRPASGTRPNKILRPTPLDAAGRMKVVLSIGSKLRNYRVHRLVMASFVGPCPDGMEVNHKNGNPSDNRLSNLEYTTPKENSLHAKRILFRGVCEDHYHARLTNESVRQIRRQLAVGRTQKSLAKEYGVSRATIGDIKGERTWKSLIL